MDEDEVQTGHLPTPLISEKEDANKEREENMESKNGGLRAKILLTVFIYVVYIFQGINDNLLGPSLIDLEYLTNSSTSSIATIFTWRSGGCLLGSIIYGLVAHRVNDLLVIGGALSLLATATFLTPTWRHLLGLSITSGAAGIAMSCNSICTSAAILTIWGQKAKPYQQALHFLLTLGWTISPQLIKPFLRLTNEEQKNVNVSGSFDRITLEHDNGTTVSLRNSSLLPQLEMSSESHIHYCYTNVASCLIVLSISSFLILICSGCRLRKMSSNDPSDEDRKSLVRGKARIIVLILLFFQAFMYGGIELAFLSLTMTFAVKYLKMSKSLASDISTVFMAMFAASRGLCVLLSKFIHPLKLFAIQIAILLSGTLIIAFAVQLHWIVPWIGFAAAGLGAGSLFPTLINWAHGYMTMKGKETAVLFSGVACTAMTVPPLIGFLFERLNPMWFAYITLILIGLFILLFLANNFIVRSLPKDDDPVLSEDSQLNKM